MFRFGARRQDVIAIAARNTSLLSPPEFGQSAADCPSETIAPDMPLTEPSRSAAGVSPGRLLVVEDDAATARSLRDGLRAEGWSVAVAGSGAAALAAVREEPLDLVILDWMLPDGDGIAVLRALRAEGRRLPVLMLTARDALEDRVSGLEHGADDYLVKPFAWSELSARVRALRRRAGEAEPLRRRVADLEIDLETREARRDGELLTLTVREFDLLAYLARHQGGIVTRAMLARDVWRESRRATPLDNVIDVHVSHLRRKVDGGRSIRLLHTIRGVGFEMRPEPAP